MGRPCKGRRHCRKLAVNSWHGCSSPGPVCTCSPPAVVALRIPSPQHLSLRSIPEEETQLTWGLGEKEEGVLRGGRRMKKAVLERGKEREGEALLEK